MDRKKIDDISIQLFNIYFFETKIVNKISGLDFLLLKNIYRTRGEKVSSDIDLLLKNSRDFRELKRILIDNGFKLNKRSVLKNQSEFKKDNLFLDIHTEIFPKLFFKIDKNIIFENAKVMNNLKIVALEDEYIIRVLGLLKDRVVYDKNNIIKKIENEIDHDEAVRRLELMKVKNEVSDIKNILNKKESSTLNYSVLKCAFKAKNRYISNIMKITYVILSRWGRK